MLGANQRPKRPAASRRREARDECDDRARPGNGAKPTETRWQRALRSLLYGQDVDRNVKAKARLGLAIVAFAAIYSIIAIRLVMFAADQRRPRRAPQRRRRTRSPPRGRIFSTATA